MKDFLIAFVFVYVSLFIAFLIALALAVLGLITDLNVLVTVALFVWMFEILAIEWFPWRR